MSNNGFMWVSSSEANPQRQLQRAGSLTAVTWPKVADGLVG